MGLAWLGLTLFTPALLERYRVPRLPIHISRRWGLLVSAMMVPWLHAPSQVSTVGFVEDICASRGLRLSGPVLSVDPSPSGIRALFTETRHLFLAKDESEASDVYLVRLRHAYSSVPTLDEGTFNLSETGAVDERNLRVHGGWAAWQVNPGQGDEQVEVLRLSGEHSSAGPGWDAVGRVQRYVTNLQQVGQMRGIGRTVLTWNDGLRAQDLTVSDTHVTIHGEGRAHSWHLGSAPSREDAQSALMVRPIEPARPGSLATWAVDRVRAIPWIGSERLQWFKAVVYSLAAGAEDMSEQIASTDPQVAVTEELGDVWGRLPVVEESPIPNWPPAPLEPRLKPPLPGEGQWIDMTHEKAFSRLETSSMLFTFIRTDPKRAYNQVSIAVWDPRRIQLHIVAGTEEPKSTLGQRGSGLVDRDPEHIGRLVGAFNGAFQAMHGEFGMMEGRVVQLPPKPFSATISTHDDGTTRLGTWPGEPIPIPADMIGMRQNMTPLVAGGAPNPYRRHWWGGVPEGWTDEARTVRSALCRTKEGHLAYFYSPGIDPEHLATALQMARCDYGIHLDMNGGHAGFELYRVAPKDLLPGLARPLDPTWEATGSVPELDGYAFNARLLVQKMPLMNFPRYIQRTPRDFFYLTERSLLPGPALELPSDVQVGPFRSVAVRGNEFPPFAVVAELSGREQGSPEAVRLDAKQLEVEDGLVVVGFRPGQFAAEGAVPALYITPERFIVDTIAPSGGLLLARHEPTGRFVHCVDGQGFVTSIELPEDAQESQAWLERLSCQGAIRTGPEQQPVFSEPFDSTTVRFSKKAATGARVLFPDTPIVPPSVWGIPQARRAQLVTPRQPPP